MINESVNIQNALFFVRKSDFVPELDSVQKALRFLGEPNFITQPESHNKPNCDYHSLLLDRFPDRRIYAQNNNGDNVARFNKVST